MRFHITLSVLASLCLLLLWPSFSAAQENTFTPWHVARMRVVTSAVISPDGKQIAYTLSVPRQIPAEKDGPSWSELHVVDTNGTSTPFITGNVNISHISWTPDGKNIAYLAKREKDETRSLYLIGGRGGESDKIVSHLTDIQGYSFSGDGKRVAYLATEPVNPAKKAKAAQGFSQEIYEEDQPLTRVWIADVASRLGPGAKTPKATAMVKLTGSASELHWNPKQDKIAVALAPNALIDEHLMFRKVHLVDLKTGEATNLKNPGKMGQLAWSPDGDILALISGADKHDPREGQLWVKVDGTNAWTNVSAKVSGFSKKLTGHVDAVHWVRDGELLVQSSDGVGTTLHPIRFAGDKSETPSRFKNLMSPRDFVVSSPSVATKTGDGLVCLAFIAHTSKHPPEVYFYGKDEKDEHPRRLTDSNPWLKDMRFAKQEVIKYKARDGLELEGILIHPLNGQAGVRYPLVLTVHGGPESHYSNGWLTLYHSLGQVAAARGMAVFYPNYRGSTGYGVEFSMKGQAAAGGKEFDDLIDGVDHLVKMGLVDEKKVGITGGSYGGYATAWGSTYYSDRFAAGVMFVGISDWISCSGTTDIPHEMNLVHHRKWLWEDWDYFAKSSPIYHVDKAKTPLLIMHGKSDPRVHPSQSMELYRHLKVRGKAPVRLVFYPGEGHGNARAASRLDYNLRLLEWMEHYLKGPGGAAPPYELDYTPPTQFKTSAANSWYRTPARAASEVVSGEQPAATPWLARGCPCCIGW